MPSIAPLGDGSGTMPARGTCRFATIRKIDVAVIGSRNNVSRIPIRPSPANLGYGPSAPEYAAMLPMKAAASNDRCFLRPASVISRLLGLDAFRCTRLRAHGFAPLQQML